MTLLERNMYVQDENIPAFFTGLPRRLRATSLLWNGDTESATDLLKDDVLVADPGTR